MRRGGSSHVGIVQVWIVQSKRTGSNFSIQNMHQFDQVVYN